MSNVEHALMYLDAGASVIPVGSDKRPLIGWKPYQNRRPSSQEIAGWYRRWPCAGVAIICGTVSRVCVLDVEHDAIPELLDLTVPDTLTVRTQGGGLHFYFEYDKALRSTTWSIQARHCGELRSDGNYVLAPPSFGPVGQYSWLRGPGTVELAVAPSWLHEIPRSAGNSSVARGIERTFSSRSEEDQQLALSRVLGGWSSAEVCNVLRARPASLDRSDPEDYCARTERRARHFAAEHYVCARIVRVTSSKDRVGVSFKIISGSHIGRTLVRTVDWPVTERSAPIWSSLSLVLGRVIRLPTDLLGLELRVGVFQQERGLVVGGRAYPVIAAASVDNRHEEGG